MIVPGMDFLLEMEKLFSVSYPRPFMEFCESYAHEDLLEKYPGIAGGRFITDLDTMTAVNSRIGFEQWSDLERAIAGKVHPKDGMRLWGELLPVYFDADFIYGYHYPEPGDWKVYVWSVHCIVHAYPDLENWLESVGR